MPSRRSLVSANHPSGLLVHVFLLLLTGADLLVFARVCPADVVRYHLPGRSRRDMILQGSTKFNPGGTVSFSHPKFGSIHFGVADVEVIKDASVQTKFAKVLGAGGKDADKVMEAANWALRHGLLKQFYETVDKALEINPQQRQASLVKSLKAKIDTPLGDFQKEEGELRQLVGRPDMKIKTSAHFILLHDTPDKPARKRKIPRADERLQLLEQVYESFFLRFAGGGFEGLEIPKERLKVVLFQEQKDYLFFATKLSPSLSSAAGFYTPSNNTSVFYDNGSTDEFKLLAAVSEGLQGRKRQAQKDRGPNAADIVRLADAIDFLIEVEKENIDITVVSHETAHQMAANTGLLPRHVNIPSWVHEGLATYFETPDGASWGGIGAVNQDRLDYYRALERDRVHSNIDFIVGDQIFDYAGTHNSKLLGYGQAWALTHFLMERHLKEFLSFYRRLGEMPPEVQLSQEVLTDLFYETFKNKNALDNEWRAYMNKLKTDLEIILEK